MLALGTMRHMETMTLPTIVYGQIMHVIRESLEVQKNQPNSGDAHA